MKTLQDIQRILNKNMDYFREEYHVKELAIFGSRTGKDFDSSSDLDILVTFSKPIGLKFVTLADELEALLKMKVDLVSKEAVRPKMMKFISKNLVHV